VGGHRTNVGAMSIDEPDKRNIVFYYFGVTDAGAVLINQRYLCAGYIFIEIKVAAAAGNNN